MSREPSRNDDAPEDCLYYEQAAQEFSLADTLVPDDLGEWLDTQLPTDWYQRFADWWVARRTAELHRVAADAKSDAQLRDAEWYEGEAHEND